MTVHLEPVMLIARFYEPGDSFENEDPYMASGVVQVVDDMAYACGFHGRMSRPTVEEFYRALAVMGIKTVVMKRHGKMVQKDISDLV